MRMILSILLCIVAAPVAAQAVHKDTAYVRPPIQLNSATFMATPYQQKLPDNYYTQHLGFFCRQELKLQQAHVPVTFRVGTIEQCNTLEQKPGYR